MKTVIASAAVAIWGTLVLAATNAPIAVGGDMRAAERAMKAFHYEGTMLEMAPPRAGMDLGMWVVDQGVLIATYHTNDNVIVGLSYYLCDERPKATRKTFTFSVKSFDPGTAELTIQCKQSVSGTTGRTGGSSVFLTRGTPLAGQESRRGSESAEP